ncbi:(2Fe-2S)-binding protein [Candidatus Woesearchaeota archaeon]|nr:(2Fe-2S)-binding protein [Candidatus Woesearchaeota archaeon]
MAQIILDNKTRDVPDGESIKKIAEDLGVAFACENGVCGVCMIEILEGKENLAELTQEEKDLGMDEDRRLACQCRIKGGCVKIRY